MEGFSMRISAHTNTDVNIKLSTNIKTPETSSNNAQKDIQVSSVKQTNEIVKKSTVEATNTQELKYSKEDLTQAVETMNELLETTQKASKFVFHEGLDKYYVKLVDSKTEEVIKEIPPERLLDAFYEMQKLAGMIVDEKI